MDLILIPGFWLDASSWDGVTPALEAAGHRVHALTLPGLESRDADRSAVGRRDHVNAVVAAVDAVDGPVVLVGHSAGGGIAHAAADARPDRVTRVVYVDSVPVGPGDSMSGFPVENGEIPFPDWSAFDDESLVDLDDDLRAMMRARAIPHPAAAASDPQVLADDRRYDVPATVITCEYPSEMIRDLVAKGHEYTAELAKLRDVEYVDLPTSHWPQFTKPAELGRAILAAVDRS